MYGVEEFEDWAIDYESDVARWEAAGGYPFGGRTQVMDLVRELARPEAGAKVLDLGCGPGILLKELADSGQIPSAEQLAEAASQQTLTPEQQKRKRSIFKFRKPQLSVLVAYAHFWSASLEVGKSSYICSP